MTRASTILPSWEETDSGQIMNNAGMNIVNDVGMFSDSDTMNNISSEWYQNE